MKQLVYFLSVTLLLSHVALGQWTHAPTHYVHPQEALHQLRLAEAALPLLEDSREDIENILEIFSNPKDILRQGLSTNDTNISDVCTNQLGYLLEGVIDGRTWAETGERSVEN